MNPCPFCGAPPEQIDGAPGMAAIKCTRDCVEQVWYAPVDEAVARWNARQNEARLDQIIIDLNDGCVSLERQLDRTRKALEVQEETARRLRREIADRDMEIARLQREARK